VTFPLPASSTQQINIYAGAVVRTVKNSPAATEVSKNLEVQHEQEY
jgi:hypothetical protein